MKSISSDILYNELQEHLQLIEACKISCIIPTIKITPEKPDITLLLWSTNLKVMKQGYELSTLVKILSYTLHHRNEQPVSHSMHFCLPAATLSYKEKELEYAFETIEGEKCIKGTSHLLEEFYNCRDKIAQI